MIYRIKYDFEGKGFALIEAETEQEAEDMWLKGEFKSNTDIITGYDYGEIEKI